MPSTDTEHPQRLKLSRSQEPISQDTNARFTLGLILVMGVIYWIFVFAQLVM